MDRSASIYGNQIPPGIQTAAARKKARYSKEFGDDSGRSYILEERMVPALRQWGVRELMVRDAASPRSDVWEISDLEKVPAPLVVGTIRMGFGHYRISMAIASAAHAMGYTPLWFDLHAFNDTTAGKIIAKLNRLYSLGSRLSQKYPLFNRLYWEPLNSEGFRSLTYNASDQKVAELMATPCRLLPRDIPFVATHAWPAQAAIHAGLSRVVNVIPDNWPMALHLAEGALHCVQSPSAWLGYRTLRGMAGREIPRPMDPGSLHFTGHYIDHELVANLEADTKARLNRMGGGAPLRVLFTVGGAGAQADLYARLIRSLLGLVQEGKVILLINVGDHAAVRDDLMRKVPELQHAVLHQDDFEGTRTFAETAIAGNIEGIHLFQHSDIFAAVYTTNLLMRACDLLITKPSELAFYPVPKLLVRRVGGHEAWGAIRSAELGDGTYECAEPAEAEAMLSFLLADGEGLALMNRCILSAAKAESYSGAYKVVALATGLESRREGRHEHA